ncbi:hypothetical protein ACH47C_13975 [Streptomyces rishiriensis]|uniref:Pepco domain-containing protein n=1 Tax=Streptomyces rishiriensis TaxID=68264 RepID=UPI0033D35B40
MVEDSDKISVVGIASGERGAFRWRPSEAELSRQEIPVSDLRQRVGNFVGALGDVLSATPVSLKGYQLREVTVSAEVTAKGTLSILGSGGEVGGTGGLTFTFTRESEGED